MGTKARFSWTFRFAILLAIALLVLNVNHATAETNRPTNTAPVKSSNMTTAKRPIILTNRWQEDWSVLANPAIRTEPFDSLKYIPLSSDDANSYVSLGITVRERFETNDSPNFGVNNKDDGSNYLLQRIQVHADIRPTEDWQIFIQLSDEQAFWKTDITPVDQNYLNVEQAFVAYVKPLNGGVVKIRIGRQEMAFDLQRFISIRNGPNVRQAFDAIWADWEKSSWRVIGFWSHVVQYHPYSAFNNVTNNRFQFGIFRVEDNAVGPGKLSAYLALYIHDNVHYLGASGNEQRNIVDVRYSGAKDGFDWDLEAMGQTGNVGKSRIQAWAVGSEDGYTFRNLAWSPRLGMQFDIASGDHRPGDGFVQTFNPLFPNGNYFTLAGYSSYANIINVKPSITINPVKPLTLIGAIGLQWRETVADAIYTQPNNAVPGTAGEGGSWTGIYGQLRAVWQISGNLSGAIEAVHFQAGSAIRRAGGHNADYFGVEMDFGW